MPQVKCSVSNCYYWAEGNECAADMILIDIDQYAAEAYDEEFADEQFIYHQAEAEASSSTCCHTFKPKE